MANSPLIACAEVGGVLLFDVTEALLVGIGIVEVARGDVGSAIRYFTDLALHNFTVKDIELDDRHQKCTGVCN